MMNDRVQILKRVAGRDSAGQPTESWSALRSTWANVKFQSGAGAIRANADLSIVKCSIRIRVCRDIDASMRARYKGIDYDIEAVLPDSDDRDFMFLVCESVK